jgi:hypothetical protein
MRLDSLVTGDCKLSMVQFPVEVRKSEATDRISIDGHMRP